MRRLVQDGLSVVVLGHFPWDTHFMQFHKAVMRELATLGYRITWVDDRIRVPRDGKRFWFRSFARGVETEELGLTRLRPWALPRRTPQTAFWSDRLVAQQIGRSLRRRNASVDVVLAYTPAERGVIERLAPTVLLYWTGDEVVMGGEQWLLDNADAVLAISDRALQEKAARTPGRVYRLSTGVDVQHFNPEAVVTAPQDLSALPRPILGYAGALSSRRIDLETLRATAEMNPSASVVLVGPSDPAFLELDGLPPNVVRLGPRPYGLVPSYIGAFDVGLVPYLLNNFNIGSDPLKVHEYLALGIPVVSTALPSLQAYADVVTVASSPSAFAKQAIAAASTRHDEAAIRRRRAAAARNGADKIASSIDAILKQVARN